MQKSGFKGMSRMMPILICFSLLAMLGIWIVWDIARKDYDSNVAADKIRADDLAARQKQTQVLTPAPQPPVAPTHIVIQPAVPMTPPPIQVVGSPLIVECRRAKEPIVIEGDVTHPVWARAQVVTNFVQLTTGAPARSKTEARLLWDDQFLYFCAVMDDADVFANVTKHNGTLWNNDVFELFLKPDAQKLGYYEFEFNAANATMEMFLPSRGSGGYGRWIGAHEFHVESKVLMRAGTTLNDAKDRDTGWVVMGKIPWSDFSPTGGKPAVGAEWRFALCRYDYSKDFDSPDSTSCAPLKESFHNYENYATLRFVGDGK